MIGRGRKGWEKGKEEGRRKDGGRKRVKELRKEKEKGESTDIRKEGRKSVAGGGI